jgi:drug/metabolite transporter (DMT)-like permease
MWVVLALVAAIGSATQDVFDKKLLLRGISPYLLGGAQYFLGGIILLLFAITEGIPQLSGIFWAAVATTVTLNIAAQLLQFRALKMGDVSLVSPMLAFSPIFLILTSFVILGEKPSALGVVGIFIVVAGSYVLNSGLSRSAGNVFRAVRDNPAGVSMLIVTLIFSISSNFDKIATVSTNPLFASAIIDMTLGASFFLLAYLTASLQLPSGSRNSAFWFLIAAGVITGTTVWASNAALSLQIVPYVIAVKRLSVVFSVLYGMVIFKERDIKERLLGAALMLIGVIFIAI